jgi:hypothetical protein
MGFGSWLKYLPLTAAPIILMSGMAVAQKDDLCFMKTSSGQRIALDKFCGKSGNKAVSDFMWDESNYDPRYVKRHPNGMWSYKPGAPYPFQTKTGLTFYPDGRYSSGPVTVKPIIRDGKPVGNQYYKEDGVTPLKPEEKYTYSSGFTIEQAHIKY